MRALITGGSGYFGRLLIPELIKYNIDCVSADLIADAEIAQGVTYLQVDVANKNHIRTIAAYGPFDVIFHLASQIDFAVASQQQLYLNNVNCAENVAQLAIEGGCHKVIFTSSNSVYLGNDLSKYVLETDVPVPIDHYGRSKVVSEEIFRLRKDGFDTIIIRCPNIIDAGRVGMLSILFEFIRDGKKCWVIGKGTVRHQCIYAQDLIDACIKSIDYSGSATFNIGSDSVPTFSEMYQYVIDRAKTMARVAYVPRFPTLLLLRVAYRFGLSPLGKYQFRMLTTDFVFDTSYIKRELGWQPTLTNGEMLLKAYEYYVANRNQIFSDNSHSANRQVVALGLLNLLKRIS